MFESFPIEKQFLYFKSLDSILEKTYKVRMDNLSLSSQAIIWAYERGVRIKNGEVISHTGKILKFMTDTSGYYTFAFGPSKKQFNSKKSFEIKVHRFVAYLKFKEKIFEKDIVVRHLDGNCKNNNPDNLELGTMHDNMMDQSPELRLRKSLNATVVNRKFTDSEIELIRYDSKVNKLSYPKIMEKWGISSKGTLSYIMNNKYKTKKD